MQKIVINSCYGGFGLSAAAVEALAARKGVGPIYWFTTESPDYNTYVPTDKPDAEFVKTAFTVPNPNDLDSEAREAARCDFQYGEQEIKRDDPDLVAVVEELGRAANGNYADLRIIEIPDGVEWEIEEYDGMEHVAEAHRTWY